MRIFNLMVRTYPLALLAALAILVVAPGTPLSAQQPVMEVPGGGQAQPFQGGYAGPQPGVGVAKPQPGPQPGQNNNQPNPKGNEQKKEGNDNSKKDKVERPDKPPTPSDPKELLAKPVNGRVEFSFTGQSWPDVLQWLANVSKLSLDYQDLPGDYLNLTTQHSHTLPEARNLINSRLRARGYTMLLSGDVLSVVKIENVDPSLIPRVSEEDLYDLQPFDLVKVSLEIPSSMEVAEAAEDFPKVLSKHGKVVALPATQRVLVIDAVANVRLVSSLLNEERLVASGKIIPAEIILKHRRAEKIIDILYVILGLDPGTQPSQMELQMKQQQAQQRMQVIQQMAGKGKDVSKLLEDKPKVYIAFNSQRNSLLVNAPPEELKVIRRTIELLDIPSDDDPLAAADIEPGRRVAKSYKLESIDAEALLETLDEIGNLHPLTEMRADRRSDILFARATPADHQKIEKMIEDMESDEIDTAVFQLTKYPADAIAEMISGLFAPKKKEDNNRRRYNPWDWEYQFMRRDDDKPAPDLRVSPDVENNQLVVRGTAEDIAEVRKFLVDIGELPDRNAPASRTRVVDALDPESTAKLLQQLRATWPTTGEGELIIRGTIPEPPEKKQPKPVEPEVDEKTKPPADREASNGAQKASRFRFAVDEAPGGTEPAEAAGASEANSAQAPGREPVVVTITPDGRLLLSSDDPLALDRLEQLVAESLPPQRRFEVYQIKYIRVSSLYLILTGLYKEEMKGEEQDRVWDWRTDSWVRTGSSGGASLAKRKPLKLDYDYNSNTLLVANATATQKQEIEELIAEYDKQQEGDTKQRRITAITLKYSRAKVVAAALKEVYRDLLSQRDKEFDKNDKKGATEPRESTTVLRFGGGMGDDDDDDGLRPAPAQVGFQGALSIGIDEISNTIIISAQEEVYDSVVKIIEVLDNQAKPTTTVAVRPIGSSISPEVLQKALQEALGTPWVGGRPEKQEQPQQPPNQNGQQNSQQPGQQPGQNAPPQHGGFQGAPNPG